MPTIENAGAYLYYEMSGNPNRPVLVLSNSLGSNLRMWDKVLPAFEGTFRVVRYDTRGHGKSSGPTDAFAIEELGLDVVRLLDELNVDRAHVCGLSLGGLVAQWLGIHFPLRVKMLVLANTGARIGNHEAWEQRIETVRSSGLAQLVLATIERWFTPRYRNSHPEDMEQFRAMIAATDPSGYIACCAVLRDADLRRDVAALKAKSLVIVGTHDPATPPSDGRALHTAIHNSGFIELDASHMSAWERPQEFAQAVLQHLCAGEKSDE